MTVAICRTLLVCAAACFAALATPAPARAQDAAEVIKLIADHEAPTLESTAEFKLTRFNSTDTIWEGQYGRKGRKGFMRGWQSIKYPDRPVTRYEEVRTFAGEKERHWTPSDGSGTIGPLGPASMDGYPTPGMLLGQAIKGRDRFTLTDCLHAADEVTLLSADGLVDGHKCLVLTFDFTTAGVAADGRKFPAMRYATVFVDPQRDYRPLQIIYHRDREGKEYVLIVDKIPLEQVGNVWLPMSGRLTYYYIDVEILDGYSQTDLKKMPPAEAQKHIRMIPKETDHGQQATTVTSWHLGPDIDDSLFTVEFPPNAKIWDTIAQKQVTPAEANAKPAPAK